MDIIRDLSGGDWRSIGRADDVFAHVLETEDSFRIVIDGLAHEDPIVRMRCADVAEKVSRQRREWLQPFKERLIAIGSGSEQHEVRWHIAQMLHRLNLAKSEKNAVVALLFDYLQDDSRIVKTCAMTALADMSADDPELRGRVVPILKRLAHKGSPAMKCRAAIHESW